MWLSLGLAGCFSSPPQATADGSTSGGSSSSGVGTSAGVTTNVDPSTTTDAESSSSSDASTSSTSSSSSESSSSESTTTVAEGCPGAGVCFPPAPPEWDGPAIMLMGLDDGMDPMCPPGAAELWRAGADPAAECDCTACGGEVECDVEFGFGSNGTCPSSSTSSGCQPFSTMLTGQLWTSLSLDVSDGSSCESPLPAEPRFREAAVGCQPESPSCDGGVCLLGPACISQSGEHECPPGYPDGSLLHMSVIGNDLSCDSCGCGDAKSGFFCSEATVSLYESADCTGAPLEDPLPYGESDMCDGDPDFVLIEDIASVDIDIPAADCSSSRDFEDASGDFVEGDPRTVCCSG